MGKEIERKFLLAKGTSIPIPDNFVKYDIKQGYIFAEKGKQVRVRLTKGKAILCIKFTGGFIRDEYEYEIPLKEGKEIYAKCTSKLEKHRLSFTVGNQTYDVDSYPNKITFVEVEFKSIKAAKKWKKPRWIGKEITGVGKYSNILLAKKKLKF